jgi:hypothetical protein
MEVGRASSWLLVFAGLAGCVGADAMPSPQPAGGAPAVAPPDDLGLNPGETMAYEVRIGGMLAGEAALAVGQLGNVDGHRAVVVTSRAATAGAAALVKHIVDEATTVIDLDARRPISLDTLVELGDRKTTAHATFDGTVAKVTYARDDEKNPHTYTINFGGITVHDTHSAMAQIRGWRATPGTRRSVFVVGGRRLWRIDLVYAGTETIGSTLGNRRAVKLDGASFRARPNFKLESDSPARTFSVWLSDDADRVPLKMTASTEFGEITMELTEYNRP